MSNIGVDLDGVGADLIGQAIDRINNNNPSINIGLTWESQTEWNLLGKQSGLDRKQLTTVFNKCWKNWRDMPLETEEYPEFMQRLHEMHHRVTVITNRDRETHEYVTQWLKFHDIYYDSLIFTDPSIHKLKYPIDTLIDDRPKTALEAGKHRNKNMFLFNRPWNLSISDADLPRNVQRLDNLLDIVGR